MEGDNLKNEIDNLIEGMIMDKNKTGSKKAEKKEKDKKKK